MCTKRIVRHNVYVIGEVVPQIIDNKLPSKRQALKVLYYNLRELKLTLSESATLAIKQISLFWEKAHLPTQRYQHCKKKLIKLYNKLRELQKNKNRLVNKKKEKEFSSSLDNLFDIAHGNIMEMVDEDKRQFLLKQREKGRIGSFEDINTIDDINTEHQMDREDANAYETKKRSKQKLADSALSNGISISTRARKRLNSNSNRVTDRDEPIIAKDQSDTEPQQAKKLCEDTDRSNEQLSSVSVKCSLRMYRKNKSRA